MRKLFIMAASIFWLTSCNKDRECAGTEEQSINQTGFRGINAGENFNLHISQGSSFDVKAKGCRNDLADLRLSIDNGGTLIIAYDHYKKDRESMSFNITLPSFTHIILGGAAEADVNGFEAQTNRFRTVLGGTAHCTVNGLPAKLELDLSGVSVLNLIGTTTSFSGSVSGAAVLKGYTASAGTADINTSGTAKAYTEVRTNLFAAASGDSRIYYKGSPAHVEIEQSGTAKVIHE